MKSSRKLKNCKKVYNQSSSEFCGCIRPFQEFLRHLVNGKPTTYALQHGRGKRKLLFEIEKTES